MTSVLSSFNAFLRYFTVVFLLLASISNVFAEEGDSIFTTRLDDARAIHLSGAVGDGVADDTAALQAAVDKAFADRKAGIVFVPEGRYRITRTIVVRPNIRIIGWGAKRPTFVLADNTPGFADGMTYMIQFDGIPPNPAHQVPKISYIPPSNGFAPAKYTDQNPGSIFHAEIANINFEIGKGNGGAVAIRFHGCQNDVRTHIDFHIGSGLAALHHAANELDNLRFYGGRYAILAEKTSAAWQVTVIDSLFEGQREAAIREHELSLTLINTTFRNTPVAIEIDRDYSDWLYGKNMRFENISRAAVIISQEKNPNNQITFENSVANNVPTFALFRETGQKLGHAGIYEVKEFNHGLILSAPGKMGEIGTRFEPKPLATMPALLPKTFPALPPTEQWVNVKTLGAKGDGTTDDTVALRKAIASHKVLYFPMGHYAVSDTLEMQPDTVMVGLHSLITSIDLIDLTPSYQGIGTPKAMVQSAKGGDNIFSGIGLFSGGLNPRAVAMLWQASERSLFNDVYFAGGHGSFNADGSIWAPYNENSTGDPDVRKRWDSQYPSLWVTNGGGGSFVNIWTPAAYAQSGMLISDTKTPGNVYQISAEHHMRTEIVLKNVENWNFYAPQTEEESAESREATAFEIHNSRNITIANLHAYRVTRSRAPMDTAVRIFNSTDIRFRNFYSNAESGLPICDKTGCTTHLRVSKFPFENAIRDASNHIDVRERLFTVLDFNPSDKMPVIKPAPMDMGAKVEKLEEGFFSISGATVDSQGKLYFVDRHQQRIFGYAKDEGLSIERDNPFDPMNLTMDSSGNLLVLSWLGQEGTVYAFKPGSPATELTIIPATPLKLHAKASIALPINFWYNGEFKDQLNLKTFEYTTFNEMFVRELKTPKPNEYVSPDGSLIIPAWPTVQQGRSDHRGWRFSENLNTYGLATAKAGERIYVIHSAEARTYTGKVNANGTITDVKRFADRGGESLAVDAEGKVYLANGQIFVYDKTGKPIGQIDVPDRPIQIILGGADKRTLYILTHHVLYSVRV